MGTSRNRDGLCRGKMGRDAENTTNEIAHNTLTFKIIEERIIFKYIGIC